MTVLPGHAQPAAFSPGDRVQYFDVYSKAWRGGTYVGPGASGTHVVETCFKTPRKVTPGWLRPPPKTHRLDGFLAVFLRDDGSLSLAGPRPTAESAAILAAEFKPIYGAPLAILDLRPYAIAFASGDGVPQKEPAP